MRAVSAVPYFRACLSEAPVMKRYGAIESPHQTLDWHQPIDQWQLLIVSHSGVLSCNGRVAPYGPRAALILPPRSRCRLERSGRAGYEHVFLFFTPKDDVEDVVALPLVSDVSAAFDTWETHWNRAFDRTQFTRQATIAWMWDVLWYLASGPENVRSNIYVEAAEKIVHDRIGAKIGVLDLAAELEISHSQLVRLFRAEHGMTIQEYIRVQRAVAAVRLLTTTTRPIKSIAAAVGVPDLQQFSRLVRLATGVSPRQIREERKSFDAHTVTHAKPGVREEV